MKKKLTSAWSLCAVMLLLTTCVTDNMMEITVSPVSIHVKKGKTDKDGPALPTEKSAKEGESRVLEEEVRYTEGIVKIYSYEDFKLLRDLKVRFKDYDEYFVATDRIEVPVETDLKIVVLIEAFGAMHEGEAFARLSKDSKRKTIYVYVYRQGEGEEEVFLPTVFTDDEVDVSYDMAVLRGELIDDGGAQVSDRGFCYATTENPDISNECVSAEGSGLGFFESEISGLTSGETYYARAYASNMAGMAYGNEVSFTTMIEEENGDGPRDTETEVVEVTNPATGQIWMDRNLGASRAATSSIDEQAYGDLYQWGRAADGHQKRSSPTTSTLSSSDQPGHGSFILAPNSPNDWRSPQNDNLWQGVNGVNNPCPDGFRLPTEAEWNAERNSWSSNDAAGALASPLKLPMAGSRSRSSGSLFNVGSNGNYWSSTVSGSNARRLYFFSSNAYMFSSNRAYGLSVRCLKDY